jgi:uncharacterized protein YndB with AHSA1/START domain
MKSEPFIIEQTYNAPFERVWRAITNVDDMKQWYFNIAEFRPEVGFEFQFVAGPDKNKQYRHICRITEVIANKKLAYNWKYDGYKGNSTVTFELFAEGAHTKIKLTHEGLETFPTDQPDFSKESFAEGWTWLIGKSLKEFVEKKSKQ